MKSFLFLFITLLFNNSFFAQFCTNDTRFSEVEFFTENQISEVTDITYGSVDGQELQMDFYFPDTSIDPLQERPFIMLMHGGSFTSGDRTQVAGLCNLLARRGFATATISYRLSSEGSIAARYKASQDAHAALRFVVNQASTYGIDPDWIFVGGVSAGAIIANALIFIDQQEWQNRDPMVDLITDYGGLFTSGNNLNETYDLKGVFNNWGSAYVIAMDEEEAVPTISFHGEMDPVVNIDLNTINFTGGSNVIHNTLINYNVCTDLTTDPNGGHGVYTDAEGILFRIGRTSCFFKSVFCETCESVTSDEPVQPTCSELLNTDDNLLYKTQISIYPNPTYGVVTITSYESTINEVIITDIQGRTVKVFEGGKNQLQLDLDYLRPSLYFVSVKTTHGEITKQLVKN